MSMPKTYDAYAETEELITAEEYLRRRDEGKIDPLKTRIVPPDIKTGSFGGFAVKLDAPRFSIKWPRRSAYGW